VLLHLQTNWPFGADLPTKSKCISPLVSSPVNPAPFGTTF
jgi:hypothetical protein